MTSSVDYLSQQDRARTGLLLRELDRKLEKLPPPSEGAHSLRHALKVTIEQCAFVQLVFSNLQNNHLEPHKLSERLADDLRLLAQREAISQICHWHCFSKYLYTFRGNIDRSERFRVDLAVVRATCLLISSGHLSPREWRELDPISMLPGLWPEDIATQEDMKNRYKLMKFIYKQLNDDLQATDKMLMPKLIQYFWLCTKYNLKPFRSEWFGLSRVPVIRARRLAKMAGEKHNALERKIVAWFINSWTYPLHDDKSRTKLIENINCTSYFIESSRVFKLDSWPERVEFGQTNTYRSGIHGKKILLLSVCKWLIFTHREPIKKFCLLDKLIELLIDLERAYELRRANESSRRKRRKYSSELQVLFPTCLELAFPTPIDDVDDPEYICEFAYFRDTIDFLKRKCPGKLRQLTAELKVTSLERLLYYRLEYDKFSVCCSRYDVDQVKFCCVDHAYGIEKTELKIVAVCPLLNRSMTCLG